MVPLHIVTCSDSGLVFTDGFYRYSVPVTSPLSSLLVFFDKYGCEKRAEARKIGHNIIELTINCLCDERNYSFRAYFVRGFGVLDYQFVRCGDGFRDVIRGVIDMLIEYALWNGVDDVVRSGAMAVSRHVGLSVERVLDAIVP